MSFVRGRFIPILAAFLVFSVTCEPAQAGLLVGSLRNNEVMRYDQTTGAPMHSPGNPGAVFASGGGLNDPEGLAIGRDGNLYVSSYQTNAVERFDGTTGAFLNEFVTAGSGGLSGPDSIRFGPDGNLYVASWNTNSVLRFDGTTGAFLGTFASGGGLVNPYDLTFGPDGNLYVSGTQSNNIVEYNGMTGAALGAIVSSVDSPTGLTFGPDGNLYVSSGDFGTSVLRFDGTTGAPLGPFASGHDLSRPRGVAFGHDGNLYVASFGSNQVLRYNGSTGAFLDAFIPAGSGGLDGPRFLLFQTQAVPEPAGVVMLGLGVLSLLGFFLTRRSRGQNPAQVDWYRTPAGLPGRRTSSVASTGRPPACRTPAGLSGK